MRKFVASCSAVVLAAAVLAACGGSSSKANPPSPSKNGGASSPSNSDLSHLVATANKQKFKIVYTDGSGQSQTYEQDGNGNSVSGSDDSQTFITKTSTVSCDKSSGTWECNQSPVSIGGIVNPFLGVVTALQSQLSALGGRFGSTSSKTIAGRDAQCVTFSEKDIVGSVGGAIAKVAGKSLKGSATYCIDKQTGATLEVASTNDSGKATTSLLVTKFESPSPSDFTPPATPSTVPSISLPSSITIPGGGTITIPTIPGGG
jgi:hypothetical protein